MDIYHVVSTVSSQQLIGNIEIRTSPNEPLPMTWTVLKVSLVSLILLARKYWDSIRSKRLLFPSFSFSLSSN